MKAKKAKDSSPSSDEPGSDDSDKELKLDTWRIEEEARNPEEALLRHLWNYVT